MLKVAPSEIAVCGRRWDSTRPNLWGAPEGLSLEHIITGSIERAYREHQYSRSQYRALLRYARCRLNGIEIERELWATTYPKAGARVEVLHGVRGGGGGGGGGGKNPIATVLGVIVVAVATIATFYIGGAGGYAAAAGWSAFQTGMAVAGIGLAAAGALYAINALFPAPTPSLGGFGGGYERDIEKTSQTYSISGGRNTAQVGGYVPLVCGRHRFTPPLGGRSWTKWEGEKQFFHMLVVWGHPDVSVSDFRIGETPLASFKDVAHKFHQSTTGNDLKYFAKSYREENVGAVIKQAEGWTSRVVGEAEAISLDFAFQRGLVDINSQNGSRRYRSVEFQAQYREQGTETWHNFGSIAATSYAGGTVTGSAQVHVFANANTEKEYVHDYDWDGNYYSYWTGRYVTTSYSATASASKGGSIQIWPDRTPGLSGCDVTFGVSGSKVTVSISNGSYGGTTVHGTTVTMDAPNFRIFLNEDGSLFANSGATQIYPTPSGIAPASVAMTAYDGQEVTATVAAGSYEGTGTYTFKAKTQNLVMRNIRMEGLPRATYEVRVRRNTADVDSSYIFDEAQWSVMRAILNEAAFKTPIPICVSELRIRASEQLSGYVDNFNALCVSNIPDWNGTAWATANTSNPASIMRYLLTTRHGLSNPYSTSKLDNAALVELWNYCHDNGYEFNFICDSEENTWSRLVQVLAPGRAAPTTDVDGLWGVVIDRNGKTPVQLFTPRNSWGMQVQRGFVDMPDALRVSFVDQTDDYVQKEAYVYNDGYSANGENGTQRAQNVIEWDFPGITSWDKIWQQGRLYMARALHRQMTVTINTDWEWLACHRGDLVGVASDVLMNVFGCARVLRLAYAVDGETVLVGPDDAAPEGLPVGVELDDSILFDEPAPARYGIALRSNTGALTTLELLPQYGQEAALVMFRNPLQSAAQVPPFGALCTVSLLGEEYDEYLVASISPGDNLGAELTLVPYKMDEIEAAISGEIPSYEESVLLDVVRGRKLPTPTISLVRSDETVLEMLGGEVSPRIAVWWKMPAMNVNASTLSYQARAALVTQEDEDGDTVYLLGNAPGTDPFVGISHVEEGAVYNVQIRATNPATGVTSEWSDPVQHAVVGRTTVPPSPRNVTITPNAPAGLLIAWDAVAVFDLDHYEVQGPLRFLQTTKETSVTMAPNQLTGELTFLVFAIDVLGLRSAPARSTYTVLPPAAPVVADALLMDDGIEMSWSNAQTTWPIDLYVMQCGNKQATSLETQGICPVPQNFERGDTVTVRARDIFRNVGDWSEPFQVRIIPPAKPILTLGVSADGNVQVSWQDCKTTTTIARYILEGAISGSTAGLSAEISVKDILWTTIEEMGVTYRIGAVTVYVTAEDKYGFQGERGGQTYLIYPPYNPVLTMRIQSDGLYLTWQDCTRTFALDHYVVFDEYYNETFVVDGTSQLLKPRPAGVYNFYVQAFDVVGNYSSRMMLSNYTIYGVGAVQAAAVIDGADILLSWALPSTTFPMDYYTIYDMHGVEMGKAKVNYFRFPAPVAGAYEYSIVGRDVAGNIGLEGVRAAITINVPLAPTVSASLAGEGVALTWYADAGENTLPVIAWDVIRQWEVERGDGVIETKEEDYGRLDVNTLTVPAMSTGEHTFMVRGIDSAGNVGPWGYVDFNVQGPGRVTFVNCATIDNNVMLYWTEPDRIFFPIAYYLFEEIEDGEYSMEIGRIDALFTSSFESKSGLYTYGITPVDVAGNRGERSTIAMQVAQPPDFILYHDLDSLFNGTRTNFVLDGVGNMIGPYADATWQENLDAIAALHGSTAEDITWQNKIGYGYEYFPDPPAASATYVEVVDVGTIVPSTRIAVTITSRALSGDPDFSCKIEVSTDNATWREISDDALMVYATQFRYVRYTIGCTGGVAVISNINYNLSVKRLTDFGHVTSNASDNGEGYVDDQTTPMLKGTWVPFNVSFTDVESLPKPNVVNNENYTAYTTFEDVLNPTGFRVYVLDKNGNRVTAEVDWVAYGV